MKCGKEPLLLLILEMSNTAYLLMNISIIRRQGKNAKKRSLS
jgi:hypothetical protein